MTNWPDNKGQAWTAADDAKLRELARQNTPTRIIALKLGRTEDAVRSRAQQLGISLAPWNQPPYGTHS